MGSFSGVTFLLQNQKIEKMFFDVMYSRTGLKRKLFVLYVKVL